MSANRYINPRHRAFGKARIDIARRVKTQQDWDALWRPPAYPFPFRWATGWKQCIEYRVDDFAAEVGFFTDVLGMPVSALSSDYVMFADPDDGFCFAVAAAPEGVASTPPDAIRIQFNLDDLLATVAELQQRGISFSQLPQPLDEGEPLYIATFETPHGIAVDLWGIVDSETAREEPDSPIGSAFPEGGRAKGVEETFEEDIEEDFEEDLGEEVEAQYDDLPSEIVDDFEPYEEELSEEEPEDDWETPF